MFSFLIIILFYIVNIVYLDLVICPHFYYLHPRGLLLLFRKTASAANCPVVVRVFQCLLLGL